MMDKRGLSKDRKMSMNLVLNEGLQSELPLGSNRFISGLMAVGTA